MTKWFVLAAGAFLLFNEMLVRTYDYTSPARYCWQMDYIDLYSCFANATGPHAVVWGTILLGSALILGCIWHGKQKGA